MNKLCNYKNCNIRAKPNENRCETHIYINDI